MEATKLSYEGWLKQITEFKGGAFGIVVVALSLATGLFGAYFGMELFPAGRYPRIVLAVPGLVAAAIVFFVSSGLLWRVKKASLTDVQELQGTLTGRLSSA